MITWNQRADRDMLWLRCTTICRYYSHFLRLRLRFATQFLTNWSFQFFLLFISTQFDFLSNEIQFRISKFIINRIRNSKIGLFTFRSFNQLIWDSRRFDWELQNFCLLLFLTSQSTFAIRIFLVRLHFCKINNSITTSEISFRLCSCLAQVWVVLHSKPHFWQNTILITRRWAQTTAHTKKWIRKFSALVARWRASRNCHVTEYKTRSVAPWPKGKRENEEGAFGRKTTIHRFSLLNKIFFLSSAEEQQQRRQREHVVSQEKWWWMDCMCCAPWFETKTNFVVPRTQRDHGELHFCALGRAKERALLSTLLTKYI